MRYWLSRRTRGDRRSRFVTGLWAAVGLGGIAGLAANMPAAETRLAVSSTTVASSSTTVASADSPNQLPAPVWMPIAVLEQANDEKPQAERPVVEVLARGLDQPLGLAWDRQSNTLFVAEGGKGRIAGWRDGKLETVVDGFPIATVGPSAAWQAGPMRLAIMQPLAPPTPSDAASKENTASSSSLGEKILNRPASKLARKAVEKLTTPPVITSGKPTLVVSSRTASGAGCVSLFAIPAAGEPPAPFTAPLDTFFAPFDPQAAAGGKANDNANADTNADTNASGSGSGGASGGGKDSTQATEAERASQASRLLLPGSVSWNQAAIVFAYAERRGAICLGRRMRFNERWLEPTRLTLLRAANETGNDAPMGSLGLAAGLVALAASPQGEVVAADPGELTAALDSRLSFFNVNNGRRLLESPCGLRDVIGLAYSPLTGQLYALDLSWNEPRESGVFQLVSQYRDGRVTLAARRVATIERPTAMAFTDDGTLYVAAAPAAASAAPAAVSAAPAVPAVAPAAPSAAPTAPAAAFPATAAAEAAAKTTGDPVAKPGAKPAELPASKMGEPTGMIVRLGPGL